MEEELFKPEYYQIPLQVAERVDPHESFVYSIIYWFYSMKDGRCYASNERICKALPYKSSTASVANAISNLSAAGLIECRFIDVAKRNRKEIIPLVRYGRGSINPQVKPINPQVNRDTPTGEQIEISNRDKYNSSVLADASDLEIVTDEDYLPVRSFGKVKKTIYPLPGGLLKALKTHLDVNRLDGRDSDNERAAKVVGNLLITHLRTKGGFKDNELTVPVVVEQFEGLLERIHDPFHTKNMTSMTYIKNNFQKIINSL